MSNNEALLILSTHQKQWLTITHKLLFVNSKLKAADIVQDMYIKVFDELTKNNLQVENLIVNNKPHYGIVKNILKRIIQVKSKSIKHHISIE